MNDSKLVSIIVPAFNSEDTIEKCIYSILKQTYQNIEVLIVDDGSVDTTYEKCLKIKNLDNRVKVFKQENSGPSAARNIGLDNAKGTYIMFVDSDDWIDKECIEVALDIGLKNDSDIVLWNAVKEIKGIQERITPLYGVQRDFNNEQMVSLIKDVLSYKSEVPGMLNISITGPVCKLFKKETIGDNRFPDDLFLGEDLFFLLTIITKIKCMTYICEYYYHIRVDNNSLSQKWDSMFAKKKSDFVNKIIALTNSWLGSDSCLDRFIFRNYLTVTERYLFGTTNMTYKDKVKNIKRYITSINRKIDYHQIHHKCAWFLKHHIYFPIYILGKMLGK